MRARDPLVVMAVVVALSLVVAATLFGILDSTGVIENKYAKFGGAAAGFFAIFILLQRWHGKLTAADAVERPAAPPDFRVPEHFTPYLVPEESLAFCYPSAWGHAPQRLDLVFIERAEQLRPGDPFPGNLNVIVMPTAKRTLTVADLAAVAEARGIGREEVARHLGLADSPAAERLAVPLKDVLAVLRIEGPTFAERLYELEAIGLQLVLGDAVEMSREVTYVDGVQSVAFAFGQDSPDGVKLAQYQTTTYVAALDVAYTFTFTDDEGDRDRIERISKEVLSTVRFWPRG